jgi:glycosyltransferase involved in cell wall biosynthesis
MKIGYILQIFPGLSETFVYREVLGLRKAGIKVKTFSIVKPKMNHLSSEASGLVKSTFYVFPLDIPLFLKCHIRYLLTKPCLYLSTFLLCLISPYSRANHRRRTLQHFCEAVPVAFEVERLGIDHLHAHFASNPATIAMFVSRLTGVPFSFTAHANDIFIAPILLPLKINASSFVVTISKYNIRHLCEVVPTKETFSKLHLVRCGINTLRFSPLERMSQSPKFTILSVGRLIEKKGFLYLIKACELLAKKGYDFRCVIIGYGPQERLLTKMVEQNHLSPYVKLAGKVYQEDIHCYFEKADLFVLPCIVARDNDMDGIPVSLMEAMAMEIPVVSTHISGIPELIEHMQSGILVPPKDSQALAEAFITLIKNHKLRSNLGKAGRRRIVDEFEQDKNLHRLIRLFHHYGQENKSVQ